MFSYTVQRWTIGTSAIIWKINLKYKLIEYKIGTKLASTVQYSNTGVDLYVTKKTLEKALFFFNGERTCLQSSPLTKPQRHPLARWMYCSTSVFLSGTEIQLHTLILLPVDPFHVAPVGESKFSCHKPFNLISFIYFFTYFVPTTRSPRVRADVLVLTNSY